ncbi:MULTISPECIES: hypothetical protein [Fusobacterium]|uniref:hypothetical protein n=1 Tax=Fusobacterium TaxID=848 RepID=UPI0025BDF20B|nr:hypothetical protein [Fusobacterium sp.]MCI5724570.1 hypothetical protein [Fusobacterium sp.]MDY5305357.1 hypothetical protein [Fusobacterium gastrosuis]MDY5795550.1 hypothetical protein [Fusobacterium gastrosuis]
MNKNKRNFLIVAIIAIIFSFGSSFGYHKYQDYKKRQELENFKNLFSIALETKNKNKDSSEDIVSLEQKFKQNLKNVYLDKGYKIKNTNLFQKFKVLLGGDNIEKFESENKKVKINYLKNRILVEESSNEKIIKEIEYQTEDNFETVHVRIDDKEQGYIRNLENIENGFGVDDFKDGSRIEFKHKHQIPSGPAVKYFTNGDREEFRYRNGQRHGFSTYYFANGDKEEVYYIDNILEGKAKYTYADGYVEIYRYKNGKRVE